MFTDPGGEGIVADILGTTGSYLGAMIGARLTPSNPILGGSIGAAVGYAVGWGAGRGLEMIAEDWCFDVTPALHGPSNNPYP